MRYDYGYGMSMMSRIMDLIHSVLCTVATISSLVSSLVSCCVVDCDCLAVESHGYTMLVCNATGGREGEGGTVSKQGISVRILQRLASTQRCGSTVSIAIILGVRVDDSAGVGELMQGGGGLVLGVAGAGQGGEGTVVDVAVGDDVVRRKTPGEGVGVAVAVGVGAVVGGSAGGLGGGLGGDGAEAGGDGAAGAAGGGLEELLEAGGGAGGGSAGGGVGEGDGVAEGCGEGVEAAAGAGGDSCAALEGGKVDGGGHVGGLCGVDLDLEFVGVVGEIARDLVVLHEGDNTVGVEGEDAALGEVRGAGDVELIFEGGAGRQCSQGVVGHAVEEDAPCDSSELDFGSCLVSILRHSSSGVGQYHCGRYRPS